MMRLAASLSLAAFLAGCGADGMPLRPEPGEKIAEPVESVPETESSDSPIGDAAGGPALEPSAEAEASVAAAAS